MLRSFLCAVLALAICVGGLMAGEATVVKFDADAGKVTLKVGDKDVTVNVKDVKVLRNDKEVPAEKIKFRENQRVEVTEKDGKVTEIKLIVKKKD